MPNSNDYYISPERRVTLGFNPDLATDQEKQQLVLEQVRKQAQQKALMRHSNMSNQEDNSNE